MNFEERVRLIKKFDSLMKREYKGNSIDYASRLDVSRSAFFRLLDYIKTEFDVPICYNRASGHYEYSKNGTMFCGFLPYEVLTEEGVKKIKAG